MSTASDIIDLQNKLAGKRANLESWWQQIAERVRPAEAQFTVKTEEGELKTERVFSGKPIIANDRFAAVMNDLLTPVSQMWHALTVEDDDLQDSQEVKEYLERLNKLLFAVRYRPGANFASQKHEGYMDIGAFGNSCLYIDEEPGVGIRYRRIPMAEVYWTQNHQGQIDTLYRRFKLNARQAEQRAKEERWTLPPKIKVAVSKAPLEEFEFIHCVRPNTERVHGRMDAKGMPWASTYVAVDESMVVSEGGYTSWPFGIGRYAIASNGVYANSPAMACWGAILTLNEEKKTILRAGQKEVDPPILLTDDGALEPFSLKSGALNHGMLSDTGEALAQPFKLGANIPLGLELMNIETDEITDSFLGKVYERMLSEKQMTAAQVYEIAQLRATILAPMMYRQHAEDLGPLIAREVDLVTRDSRYPWIVRDMPDELRERWGRFKIDYRSPLARAMRAGDALAIQRTLESLPAALAVDPNAAFVIDVPDSFRELAEINGMPAKLIRDKKTVDGIVQQKQQSDQLAQATAMAPEMSAAALNAAKAEQIRTGT